MNGRRRRLAVALAALTALGMALSGTLPLSTPILELPVPGTLTLLNIELTPARTVGFAVAVIACALLEVLLRSDPRLAGAPIARTAPFWVLPACSVLALFEGYGRLNAPLAQALLLIVGGVLVGLTALGQLRTLDPQEPGFHAARSGLNALTYGLGLALFLAALSLLQRGILAVPLIALGSAGLALETLRSLRGRLWALWGKAALVGLMMGELGWVLTTGALSPCGGAFLLLAVFYLVTGLLQQRQWGQLTRRAAVEYLAVTVVCMGVVFCFGWQG